MREETKDAEAEAEVSKYLSVKYGTAWAFPNEYYDTAVHFARVALDARAEGFREGCIAMGNRSDQ